MRRGLILINSYARLDSLLHQSYRMRDELEHLGVSMDIMPTSSYIATIQDSAINAVGGYDFVVYHDKDKYVGAMLEKAGLRLFNSSRAVEYCDDKMTTYIRLACAGVPIVDTMPGLLCFDRDEPIADATVDRIEREFGYPVIVKECYGSLGKGVHKCDSRAELVSTMESVKCVPHLFQRYIASSRGRDIRVIVVGDRCVTAMLRESSSDFRSNIELGGKGTPIDITPEIERIALGATRVLGLDYAGIDLLFGEIGLVVCEVNSNAFFGGIEAVTHVNVARTYAEYIMAEVYNEDSERALRESMNHISITNVGLDRCRAVLDTELNEGEILLFVKALIMNDDTHISRHDNMYYVSNHGTRFTINADTMMIGDVSVNTPR